MPIPSEQFLTVEVPDRSRSRVFYVWALRELSSRRSFSTAFGLFGVGALVQGVGNAAMAAAAGLLARGFLDGPGAFPVPPLVVGFLGLIAAAVKTGAGAVCSYGQRRAAFQVACA